MNLSIWFRALELNATATKSEVKSAYYRLCQIYHPDKANNCPKSAQRFRTINEAYEGLMKAPLRQTTNVQPKPKYTEPKPRYTDFRVKYTEPNPRYFYSFTPPKSRNTRSNYAKSKASSEQEEWQKQEFRFERYVTKKLRSHIIFDPYVEEQIRECYRLRFQIMTSLNEDFENDEDHW